MTAGMDALAEAAREETARVYRETLEQCRARHHEPAVTVDADDLLHDRVLRGLAAARVIKLRRRVS